MCRPLGGCLAPISDVCIWHSSWSGLPLTCLQLLSSPQLLLELWTLQSSAPASYCCAGAVGLIAGSWLSSGNGGKLGTESGPLSLPDGQPAFCTVLDCPALPLSQSRVCYQSSLLSLSSMPFIRTCKLTTFPLNSALLVASSSHDAPEREEATHLFPLPYNFPALTQI